MKPDFIEDKNDKHLTSVEVVGLEDIFDNATASQSNAVDEQHNAAIRNCTVKEASELLGVPTSTIYRRIKAGKYEITGKTDSGAKLIELQLHTQFNATAPQSNAVDEQHNATAQQPNATILLVADLTKRLEAAAVRVGYLEAENQRYQEEVKLIPDLQGQAIKAAKLEAELKSRKAPWWRRLWLWFKGGETHGSW